ncbi:hypothetical protein Cantr_00240 [Candida viswanathii]|uniref:Uncharacterized protein n=1 Tax=Candida viswanathii TaxID=5486 RepID=A0A367YEV1_9ASCO|nr:hypothetical protein Cantr_00240 [Candida viswanathii]
MATYAKKRNNVSRRARLSTTKPQGLSIFDDEIDSSGDTLQDIFPEIDGPSVPFIPSIKKPSLEKKPKVILPKNKARRVSKTSTTKTSKPKPKKKKVDPWDDLLSNIEDIPVHLPKISLEEDSDDDDDDITAESAPAAFTIDINFDDTTAEPVQPTQPTTALLPRLPTIPPAKTYSQDRSYRIEDQVIDVKQELGESISKKHDFGDDDNDNNGDVVNVNDLRTAGRLNQYQDIIDGLVSNMTNLQLSSLLELVNNEHAEAMFGHVIKLVDCEKEIIRYVSSVVAFQVFQKTPETVAKYLDKLHLVWLGLKLRIDSGQVARIYRDVIQKLATENYSGEFLGSVDEYGAMTKKLCLLILEQGSELELAMVAKFLESTEDLTSEDHARLKLRLDTRLVDIEAGSKSGQSMQQTLN